MQTGHRTGGWLALALLCGAASAVPLWSSRFLPFQDAPQHLASITLLAGTGQAAELTRRWFEIDFSAVQYTGVYLPLVALARMLGPDAAIRALLTLLALLLPFSAWLLFRAFGRDGRLAVFAPALFHTAPLYIGIYNFVAAVPVAACAVALAEKEVQSPRAWRAVLLALTAAALLYLHLSGFAVALVAAAMIALTADAARTRKLRAVLPFAPALLVIAGWKLRHAPRPPALVAPEALKTVPVWQTPFEQVHDLLRFANVIRGRADELALLLLAVLFVLLLRERGPHLSTARPWRLPLLALGLLATYAVAPIHAGYLAYIHTRVIPFFALFALGSAVIAQTRRASALLAAAAAVQVLYFAWLVPTYRRFDAEAQAPQLEAVLGAAQPGHRLLALMLHRRSQVMNFEPYLHFGLYYEVLRGGRARFNFGELPWMPVRFRRDLQAAPLPFRWEFDAGLFDWRQARDEADYVLVRTPDPDPLGDVAEDPEPGPPFAEGFELIAHAGRWELFAPGGARRAASSGDDARDARGPLGLAQDPAGRVDHDGGAGAGPDGKVGR